MEPPITLKASLSSAVVKSGHKIRVDVSAFNRSKEVFVAPSFIQFGEHSMMDGFGIVFRKRGEPSDNRTINRFAVNSSPPSFDEIAAGGHRNYYFYWTPSEDEIGDGRLELRVPNGFEAPHPMLIKVLP